MDRLYQTIAEGNELEAKAICNKYGYSLQNVNSTDDLAVCLEQLVAAEGKTAFYDIVALHPDKDLILEMFGNQTAAPAVTAQDPQKKCPCQEKSSGSKVESYLQATTHGTQMQQGNIFLMGGILILAVAIITSAHSK